MLAFVVPETVLLSTVPLLTLYMATPYFPLLMPSPLIVTFDEFWTTIPDSKLKTLQFLIVTFLSLLNWNAGPRAPSTAVIERDLQSNTTLLAVMLMQPGGALIMFDAKV